MDVVFSQVRAGLTVGSHLCTKLALGERQPYKVGSPENEILTYLIKLKLFRTHEMFFFLPAEHKI